ncbi:hypothetical protein VITFI_CDS0716 [Vitreoscilla filiformis]|uniref:Teneurin TTR-like domain-containing protein n=2 Tax=Vitreoscilla filiformis TaxID=63 RepID=A0A221KBZ0_VITFI|nr:hypothetical protein VITFI_CDS0716 [Vitreoscilla filiformis]
MMKQAVRQWLLGCVLAGPGVALAAAVLQGIVVQNEERGQPLANVAVSAPGTNDTVSRNDGTFALAFPNAKPGGSVTLALQRSGWEVVNHIESTLNLPAESAAQRVRFIWRTQAGF